MTWEAFTPAATSCLRDGEASLDSRGRITILDADLERAGILSSRVAIMLDREGRRIMLREPASRSEPSVAITVANQKRTRTSKIHIRPAIRKMGLKLDGPARCSVDVIPNGGARALVVHLPLERERVLAKPLRPAGDAS